MVYAMKNYFRTIVSIELSDELANRSKRRFRKCPHIHILQGDSGEVLPKVLSNISTRCVFWLDGHYSEGITARGTTDTPVMREMQAILGHKIKDHVILIDDARCFDGTHDYPTLICLQELVTRSEPGYEFSVFNDIIRIHPGGRSLDSGDPNMPYGAVDEYPRDLAEFESWVASAHACRDFEKERA